MVEYKKKKIVLQSGGTRNFYYKVSSNGKKKQVSKKEYLEKKGGHKNNPSNNNWEAPRIMTMNNFNKELSKTNKMPSFTVNIPHEGPTTFYCNKMIIKKFENQKDDQNYFVCSEAEYNIPPYVYIYDQMKKEYKQIGTFNDNKITYTIKQNQLNHKEKERLNKLK